MLGEVYEVNDSVLKRLDELELVPTIYHHCTILVDLITGETHDNRPSAALTCTAYMLLNFRPELLQCPMLDRYEDYSKYVRPTDRPLGTKTIISILEEDVIHGNNFK